MSRTKIRKTDKKPKSPYAIALGKRLLKVRADRGFGQEKVSKDCNVGRSTLSDYENGFTVPHVEFIVDFSANYNVDLLQLIKGEEQTGPMNYSESHSTQKQKKHARVMEKLAGYVTTDQKKNEKLEEVIVLLMEDAEMLETIWRLVTAQDRIKKMK